MSDINEPSQTAMTIAVVNKKRLQRELMAMMKCEDKCINAFPSKSNILFWTGVIEGPENTPYQGLSFKIQLTIPDQYPFVPPIVKFVTNCYHPNVDAYGNICMDILKENWSASYTIRSLLLSIRSLLAEPNNFSPLNDEAASLWADTEAFTVKVRESVQRPLLQINNTN